MYIFLRHYQINKTLYDSCIESSTQSIIYSYSWYLDIVSPGWCALVKIVNNEYQAVIPLPIKSFIFLNFLYQPIFAQQLGLFSITGNKDKEDWNIVVNQLKKKFIKIHYQLNEHNKLLTNFQEYRKTHHLFLNKEISEIRSHYSENVKRKIRNAEKNNSKMSVDGDIETLITLFKQTVGSKAGLQEKHYRRLVKISSEAIRNGMGFFRSVKLDSNVSATAFFLLSGDRIIYLIGASSDLGRKTGAMSLLIDFVITEFSSTKRLLDFEGGTAEELGRYYRGFGATEQTYPILTS